MQERTEVAQEVKLLAHLSHVNVVKFFDNFVDNGVMHIVMEFATGGTLYKQIVNREVLVVHHDAALVPAIAPHRIQRFN